MVCEPLPLKLICEPVMVWVGVPVLFNVNVPDMLIHSDPSPGEKVLSPFPMFRFP